MGRNYLHGFGRCGFGGPMMCGGTIFDILPDLIQGLPGFKKAVEALEFRSAAIRCAVKAYWQRVDGKWVASPKQPESGRYLLMEECRNLRIEDALSYFDGHTVRVYKVDRDNGSVVPSNDETMTLLPKELYSYKKLPLKKLLEIMINKGGHGHLDTHGSDIWEALRLHVKSSFVPWSDKVAKCLVSKKVWEQGHYEVRQLLNDMQRYGMVHVLDLEAGALLHGGPLSSSGISFSVNPELKDIIKNWARIP